MDSKNRLSIGKAVVVFKMFSSNRGFIEKWSINAPVLQRCVDGVSRHAEKRGVPLDPTAGNVAYCRRERADGMLDFCF